MIEICKETVYRRDYPKCGNLNEINDDPNYEDSLFCDNCDGEFTEFKVED